MNDNKQSFSMNKILTDQPQIKPANVPAEVEVIETLPAYKAEVVKRISEISPVLQKVALGDFSAKIPVPEKEDEFTELLVGINLMVEDLEQMVNDFKDAKKASMNILEDLNESKVKDEALLSAIGDGIVAVDESGNIAFVNDTAKKLLGMTQEELVGQWFSKTIIAFDQKGQPIPLGERPMTESLSTGEKVQAITYYSNKDKKLFPVAVTVSPIILNEKPIGAIEVFRDITHEREVDRMKTEFISLASHQLRTPLSAMKWFSEMLLAGDAGKLTPEQQEMIKNIYDSNERMVTLVNSLLNVSRIESGRIIIDPKVTDLGELSRSVITELTVKFKEKNITPVVSVNQNLDKISIDPNLIRQVYINLLTNAIKYTPNGGEVSVFISKKDDQIISQVSDTGMGIPKAQQNRVFSKFFRADNAIKTAGEGTGLGLYLIKAIVESSGGKIWFQSDEGKGTSFWFSLPLAGTKAQKGEVTLNS